MNPLTSSAIAALVRQGIAGRAQAAVGRLTLPLVCGLVALQFTLVALGLLTVAFWLGLLVKFYLGSESHPKKDKLGPNTRHDKKVRIPLF